MKKVLGFVAALLLFTAGHAMAFTCTPTGGCTVDLSYTEPSTVAGGGPLTNLTSTTYTISIATDGAAPVALPPVVIPASRAQGGGVITRSVSLPTVVTGHSYVVSAVIFATNPEGNSANAVSNNLPIPRNVPNPPVGGSVQ